MISINSSAEIIKSRICFGILRAPPTVVRICRPIYPYVSYVYTMHICVCMCVFSLPKFQLTAARGRQSERKALYA